QGTTEIGSTVTLSLDGSATVTIPVNVDGTWTYQVTSPLTVGSHTWTVTATDVAGNVATDTRVLDVVDPAAAPTAAAGTGGLLGLLGGNLLGIIDLSQQQFVVGDVNGDLKQVQVYYNSGLGVSLGSIN